MNKRTARKVALIAWASQMVMFDSAGDLPDEDAVKVIAASQEEGRKILARQGIESPFTQTSDIVRFLQARQA